MLDRLSFIFIMIPLVCCLNHSSCCLDLPAASGRRLSLKLLSFLSALQRMTIVLTLSLRAINPGHLLAPSSCHGDAVVIEHVHRCVTTDAAELGEETEVVAAQLSTARWSGGGGASENRRALNRDVLFL